MIHAPNTPGAVWSVPKEWFPDRTLRPAEDVCQDWLGWRACPRRGTAIRASSIDPWQRLAPVPTSYFRLAGLGALCKGHTTRTFTH